MAYYSPDDTEGETYRNSLLTLTIDQDDEFDEMQYASSENTRTYGELTVEPTGTIVPGARSTVAEWLPLSPSPFQTMCSRT